MTNPRTDNRAGGSSSYCNKRIPVSAPSFNIKDKEQMQIELKAKDAASAKNHNVVARTLRNALTLGHFEAWNAFSAIAAARLDEREQAAMAFAALKAQTPDHAWMVVEAALDDGAGPPLPPFMHITSEATFWASIASTQERKVYVLAAFNALHPEEQRDFLQFVTTEVAA